MYIPQERILLDQHFTDATEALTKIGEYLVNQEIVSLPYVKSLLRRHQKQVFTSVTLWHCPMRKKKPSNGSRKKDSFDPSA